MCGCYIHRGRLVHITLFLDNVAIWIEFDWIIFLNFAINELWYYLFQSKNVNLYFYLMCKLQTAGNIWMNKSSNLESKIEKYNCVEEKVWFDCVRDCFLCKSFFEFTIICKFGFSNMMHYEFCLLSDIMDLYSHKIGQKQELWCNFWFKYL